MYALCQVWLKLVLRFSTGRFFNFVNVFSLFRNHLPLEKGGALNLNKFEPPSPQRCFDPSVVEIGPVVLEKKMKLWKVVRRTDKRSDRRTADDRWSEKLTWVFSSGELKRVSRPNRGWVFWRACIDELKIKDWLLTTFKLYACYAVKFYKNKPKEYFKQGARARCAGTGSAVRHTLNRC